MVLTAVLLFDAVMLGFRAPMLVTVNLPAALAAALIRVSIRPSGPLRRRANLAAYLMGAVGILATLLPLVVAPELGPVMAAYVPIVILASGLFLPWGSLAELGFLCLAVVLVALFAASPFAVGLPSDGTMELVAVAATASLTAFAGHEVLQRQRLNVFQQRLQLGRLHETARRQRRELEGLTAQLEVMARHDPLTGAGNRLLLAEELRRLDAEAPEARAAASAVMIDIDHFKGYNDLCGHVAGDNVLRQVVRAVSGSLRGRDQMYRFGGEEFLVVLEGTAMPEAVAVAERLRQAVAALEIPNPANEPWQIVTVSAGVAEIDRAAGIDAWIAAADRALYASKASGRNRVTGTTGPSAEDQSAA